MRTKLLLLCAGYAAISCTQAQAINPFIQWQRSFGGTSSDKANSIQQTKDGGYIMAGYTWSNDGDVAGKHGQGDYWVVKLNNAGTIQWQKALGGGGKEEASSIQQTKDGGYIVAGYSFSNNGNVTGNHGKSDYWIVKLKSNGTIQWQKCLGGAAYDYATSVRQTTDSGYIVAGYTNSNDGDVTGHRKGYDYWVVKLDTAGSVQWQKTLGGSYADMAADVYQTIDGGYVVCGSTASNDGDVSGLHEEPNYFGSGDYWIVKLSKKGAIQQKLCLGGFDVEEAKCIQQTTDGGYIIAGSSFSKDGDVTGNHGSVDGWIVKVSTTGVIQWQKSLGGSDEDWITCVQQTRDGGYIVSGNTNSADGDITDPAVIVDAWVVKLDASGNIKEQTCLGGTSTEEDFTIQQTKDGGYIMAGGSASNDGDVSGNHGNIDAWIVKLKPTLLSVIAMNAKISPRQKSIQSVSPNPSSDGIFVADLGAVKNNLLITVTNNAGRLVYTQRLSSARQLSIRLNNQPKGIYHLSLRYDGGVQTAKLLIE